MTVRCRSVRPDDVSLRQRMRAIGHERRRFGYRRIHIMLKRDGIIVKHKKLFRLYREEKLSVLKRGGRERAIGTLTPDACAVVAQRALELGFHLGSAQRWP